MMCYYRLKREAVGIENFLFLVLQVLLNCIRTSGKPIDTIMIVLSRRIYMGSNTTESEEVRSGKRTARLLKSNLELESDRCIRNFVLVLKPKRLC